MQSTFSVVSFLPRLLLAALLALCGVLTAAAEPAPDAAKVEFVVWSQSYTGTVGNRKVEVLISRVANDLSGTYCYQPCSEKSRYVLLLTGDWNDGEAALSETDTSAKKKQNASTGGWALNGTQGKLSGTWTSPDGARSLPVELMGEKEEKPFPFEIRLVADHLPDANDEQCSDTPYVTEIRLYRDGKMVQALPTDSEGTCGIFTPGVVDMNFDGWPDLMLAQTQPAGPNIPYDSWLYDPAAGRFTPSPPSLAAITSPEFDSVRKLVWNGTRGSCCEHGINVYRWKGNELEQADSGESYFMPVKQAGKLTFCYIMPGYVDGHVEYPDAVWDTAGVLSSSAAKSSDCMQGDGSPMPGATEVNVYRKGEAGRPPVLVRSEQTTTKRVDIAGKPMDCPLLPVLDGGKVTHVLMKGENWCAAPD